jgi:hypothetical protein
VRGLQGCGDEAVDLKTITDLSVLTQVSIIIREEATKPGISLHLNIAIEINVL